jgi:hypothetical protein
MDTGSVADTGATDSGSIKDTGPIDTGPPDTGSVKDTGADTSTCEPVTLNNGDNDGGSCPAPVVDTCAMGDVAGFTNTWVPPSGLHQGVCSSMAMDGVYTGCLASGATETSCNDAATTYADCYNCVITFEGMSATYGPLIDTNNDLVEINVAGCIALLEPCNLTCAEEVQAASECENAACESNCPISTTASVTAFDTCEDTAASCDPNGCDTFATQATCADELTGAGHPASICVATYATFADYYDAVVPVFCGP